jgi:hypothetical protein
VTDRGHTFDAVLAWGDDVWEDVHDFIQWLFPNDAASAFNATAPRLTPQLAALWVTDQVLRDNLDRAFARWLRFVGVERTAEGGFDFREPTNTAVWAWPNHNWLRITRVLTCLRLLARAADARALGEFLLNVAAPRYGIPEDTLRYWRSAAGGT